MVTLWNAIWDWLLLSPADCRLAAGLAEAKRGRC